ncbi:MAG: alpha-1,2-fucosyltransferase [Deltaproteobacteria bacterium]
MENKSVIVGLSGGLGNQLFQYAAGRSLSLRLNAPLKLDLSWFLGRTDRFYALAPFAVSGATCIDRFPFSNMAKALSSRISRKLFFSRMGVPIRREPHFHFDPFFENIQEPCFLEGYWQSEAYFEMYQEQILQDFNLIEPVPERCKAVAEEIKNFDAICVHVRRGDYISNPKAAKLYGICSVVYYQTAVRHLGETVKNPKCFIFSDDLAWVKNSLQLPFETKIVDINSAESAHWDLYLMAQCKHFVIANSSLSWWGAWLGKALDKKVVAPSRWFLLDDKTDRDLIPKRWERL